MFNSNDSFRLSIVAYDANFNLVSNLGYLPVTNDEDFIINSRIRLLILFQEYTAKTKNGNQNYTTINKELFKIFIGKKNPFNKNKCDISHSEFLSTVNTYDLESDDRLVSSQNEARQLILDFSREYSKFNNAMEKIKKIGKK